MVPFCLPAVNQQESISELLHLSMTQISPLIPYPPPAYYLFLYPHPSIIIRYLPSTYPSSSVYPSFLLHYITLAHLHPKYAINMFKFKSILVWSLLIKWKLWWDCVVSWCAQVQEWTLNLKLFDVYILHILQNSSSKVDRCMTHLIQSFIICDCFYGRHLLHLIWNGPIYHFVA